MNEVWRLADHPLEPLPRLIDFVRNTEASPAPGLNQMLTRTLYVSLDPYQWWYKLGGTEKPGAVCHARTISQVVESRLTGFAEGDYVFNTNGWAREALTGEGVPRPAYMIPRKLDPALGPISYGVGVLGMLGLTAYAGMMIQCAPRPGETVVVSAASGGVGQIAGQLARIAGARVVGVAGPEEKCRHVVETLGFDACVSHRSPTLPQDLAAACPDGVDAYFENVGGKVFDAVVPLFNPKARMSLCGVIAALSDGTHGDAKGALLKRAQDILESRQIKVMDLFVGAYVADHEAEFLQRMSGWVKEGRVKYREDIRQGFENIPAAFIAMLKGETFGKTLVQI
jgi:NADPH-dependent curcumin reductase